MPNPSVRRASKVCQHCGAFYRPTCWGQRWAASRYCSRACSHAARPRAARVAAGRKGGQVKAANAQRPETVSNRHKSIYRRGFADGYEAALRSLDPAYAQACDLASRGRMRLAAQVERKGAA